ncbi:tyrosine-type recombinase/integrase [Aliikangiella sp. IMCC44653]
MKASNSFSFNEQRLKALSVDTGQVDFSDSSLSGLIIRVTKTKKVFYVRRNRKGKHIRVKIGDYSKMNYKQAKALALKALRDIENGINPNEQRKEHESESVTLQKAFEAYLSEKQLKDKTILGYTQAVNCYLPEWKERPLKSLNEDEITNIHKQVSARSRAQADLMARVLRAIFNFAKYEFKGKNGTFIFSENPVKILSHKRQWNNVPRKNTRIRPNELKRYLSAIEIVRTNPKYDQFTRSVCGAVEFALFTGLRKGEVLGLEWDRVNLKDGYFWIAETKNGDPLELPITDTLRKLLLRSWADRDQSEKYVFVGKSKGQAIKEPKYVLEKINKATIQDEGQSTLVSHWHDLRRTYATIAESIGIGGYTLKRLLNHRTGRSNDVTAGYIVLSADELKEPAKLIEQTILEHAGLSKRSQGVDAKLRSLLENASEAEKRALIFQLSQSMEQTK